MSHRTGTSGTAVPSRFMKLVKRIVVLIQGALLPFRSKPPEISCTYDASKTGSHSIKIYGSTIRQIQLVILLCL